MAIHVNDELTPENKSNLSKKHGEQRFGNLGKISEDGSINQSVSHQSFVSDNLTAKDQSKKKQAHMNPSPKVHHVVS